MYLRLVERTHTWKARAPSGERAGGRQSVLLLGQRTSSASAAPLPSSLPASNFDRRLLLLLNLRGFHMYCCTRGRVIWPSRRGKSQVHIFQMMRLRSSCSTVQSASSVCSASSSPDRGTSQIQLHRLVTTAHASTPPPRRDNSNSSKPPAAPPARACSPQRVAARRRRSQRRAGLGP